MKRPWYALAAIVFLVCSAYAIGFIGTSAQKVPSEEGYSDMEATARNPQSFSTSKAIQKILHWKDIDIYRAEMQKNPNIYDSYKASEHYYDLLGPDIMLDVLEENPQCHLKSHNLGRLIYIKNNRELPKALSIAGSRCSYGAFHGILGQVLDDASGTTTAEHLTDDAFVKTALTFCDRDDVKKQAVEGACVHSIGHAFMLLFENDFDKALKQCGIFSARIRQYYCVTGVFMQREKTKGQEDASSSNRFPCDTYEHPAACYRYKLRDVFPISDYKGARNFCASLEHGAERNGCFHGLGFTYYLIALKKPSLLTNICSSDNETDRRMCVEGVAGRFEIFYNRESVLRVCESQPNDVRQWCERALFAGSGFGINSTSDNIDMYFQPKPSSP